MKFHEIFIISLLIPYSLCQFPILDSQPFFRGLISAIPTPNTRLLSGDITSDNDIESRPVVAIRDGVLRGFTLETVSGRNISAFQSIPYALPPVGPLRFRSPVKNEPWTGIRDASPQSPQCVQTDFNQAFRVHGEESCLYLNVYTPQSNNSLDKRYPVMFFIHGGGFLQGAGNVYGPRYLLDREIVLVTVNYRIGIFGFFSTGDDASPGNHGLKDQLLALKWVQDNIAAFGGDPNSVTIFGQSAGASSVGLHIVSPESRGLFHRGIQQTSSAFCYNAVSVTAPETARRTGGVFNCPTNSSYEMVECLRSVSAELLAPVQLKFAEWLAFPLLVFAPVVEHEHADAFITKTPEQYYQDGEAANVTLISGLTKNELSLIIAALFRDPIAIVEINTDWNRVGPSLLELKSNTTELQMERMRNLWEFYMGDKKLTWETRLNISQMLSDRHFTECSLEGMRYHSMYTNQPVYGYQMTYSGKYSYVQQIGALSKNWGVVHGDELIYLLDNPDHYASIRQEDPDMEMVTMMTGIWSNFAATDRPFIPNGNRTEDIWQPIESATNLFSPLRFLDLKLNAEMMDDPYVERYNFWRRVINSNP